MMRKNKCNHMSMKNMMGRNNQGSYFNQFNGQNPRRFVTLYEGIRSTEVERLQKILNDLVDSYEDMEILVVDGSFGQKTRKNLEIFQLKNGLTKNGVADETTWNKLHEVHSQSSRFGKRESDGMYMDQSKNVLKVGSRGRYVMDLQRYLNQIAVKYNSIPRLVVDGIFGPNTKAAVLEFQRLFNVNDGIEGGLVGDVTWSALEEAITGNKQDTNGD